MDKGQHGRIEPTYSDLSFPTFPLERKQFVVGFLFFFLTFDGQLSIED